MSSNLIIPNEFNFNLEPTDISKSGNFVSFAPIAGTSFNAGGTFSIKVASNNSFIDFENSYLKYNLSITDTSASTSSYLGGASILYSVTERCSGLQISSEANYNNRLGVSYSKLSSSTQNKLAVLEGYKNTGAFSYTSLNNSANGRTVYHKLQTPVANSGKFFPLCFVNDYTIDVILANLADVQILAAASGYTVSNVSFVAHLIQPTDIYLSKVQAAMNAGRSMKIPLNIIRSSRTTLSTATSQQINLSIPVAESVTGILITQRGTSKVNSATQDSFNNYTNNALTSYHVEVGSNRFPLNFEIGCQNNVSYSAVQPENVMFASMFNSAYGTFNWTSDVISGSTATNTEEAIVCPLACYSGFNKGLASSDGRVSVVLSYGTAPAGTEVVDTYVALDALFTIDASGPQIRYVGLSQ